MEGEVITVPACNAGYSVILKRYLVRSGDWLYSFNYQKDWPNEDGIFESPLGAWDYLPVEQIIELITRYVHPDEHIYTYKVSDLPYVKQQ